MRQFNLVFILLFFANVASAAISANSVWDIRPGGSNTNGCFFVTGASGTDYSKQDAAQYALTGVTSAGAGNVVLHASAAAAMVGNGAYLVSGTNGTVARYEVTAVTPGVDITLSTNKAGTSIATAALADGVLNIGGGCKLADTLDDDIFEDAPANGGNIYYIKSGSYTIGEGVSVATVGATALHHKIIGYNATQGDAPTIASGNQPVITLAANAFSFGAAWSLYNITVTGTGTTNVGVAANGIVSKCKISNTSGTANRPALIFSGGNNTLSESELISTAGYALSVGATNFMAANNYIHDSSVGIKVTAASTAAVTIRKNIIDTVAVSGIDTTAGAFTGVMQLNANTIYCAATPAGSSSGVAFAASSANISMMNNIITGCVTGVNGAGSISVASTDYNNFYNNTTARTNWATGTNDIALDPGFTDAPNGNFAIGTNMQRVGGPATFPGGLTADVRDIGAAESNYSGWWTDPGVANVKLSTTYQFNSLTNNRTGTQANIATGGIPPRRR